MNRIYILWREGRRGMYRGMNRQMITRVALKAGAIVLQKIAAATPRVAAAFPAKTSGDVSRSCST